MPKPEQENPEGLACTCPRIKLGMKITDLRNWNCDCPEHGTKSAWWHSPEQNAKRERDRERLIDLQRRAAEAKKAAGR